MANIPEVSKTNCCEIIIPPACQHKCDKLIDACCVINQDNLPCINPSGSFTATGHQGDTYIKLSEPVTLPDSGNVAISDASGCIPNGTEVTGVVQGVYLYLDSELTCSFEDNLVTLTPINQKQCDINKAFDEAICKLGGGCPVWNNITDFSDPVRDFHWGPSNGTVVQVSDPLGCIVRFSGVISNTSPIPINGTDINSQLFVLPVGSRPPVQKILSLNVVVNGIGGQWTALFLPAILLIAPDGRVNIAFTNYNPNIVIPTSCTPCGDPGRMASFDYYWGADTAMNISFSLDGLTFNTA